MTYPAQVRQVRREEERLSRDIPDPTDPAYRSVSLAPSAVRLQPPSDPHALRVVCVPRCIVCTLPGGTCEHTPAWVRFAFEAKLTDPVSQSLLI